MIAAGGIVTGLLAAPFGARDWLAIPSGTRASPESVSFTGSATSSCCCALRAELVDAARFPAVPSVAALTLFVPRVRPRAGHGLARRRARRPPRHRCRRWRQRRRPELTDPSSRHRRVAPRARSSATASCAPGRGPRCSSSQQRARLARRTVRDTTFGGRYLSTMRLEIDGQRPWLCEAAANAPEHLQFVYTYPEVAEYEGGGSGQAGDDEPRNRGLPQRGLNFSVTYRVELERLSATASCRKSHEGDAEFELGWHLDADFADIQEAQAGRASSRRRSTSAAGQRDPFEYPHERLPYRRSAFPSPAAMAAEPRGAAIGLACPPKQPATDGFEARVSARFRGELPTSTIGTRVPRAMAGFTRIRAAKRAVSDGCQQHPRLRVVSARSRAPGRMAGAPGWRSALPRALRPRRHDRRVAGGLRRSAAQPRCRADEARPDAERTLRRLARRGAGAHSVSGAPRTARASEHQSVLGLLRRLREPARCT